MKQPFRPSTTSGTINPEASQSLVHWLQFFKLMKMFFLISTICLIFGFSKAYAQKVLFIETIDIENKLEVIASIGDEKQSFTIDNSFELFWRCFMVDDIVSTLNKGKRKYVNKLNQEIDSLSLKIIKPLTALIDSSELINIKVSVSSLRIPFEFLRYRDEFLYKQKPILFSYKEVAIDEITKLDLQKGFIVCDLTADPENACSEIHKKFPSDFHYISEVNNDSVRNAQNMDFILMSVHGDISVISCEGNIGFNEEELIPSVFTQENLKLVYFDSCHLGKAKNFIDRFKELGVEYYLGQIISNEAGNSSTKTMLTFFKYLEDYDPLESLMKTKKELIQYTDDSMLVELWFAAPFRLYKMN